MFSMLFLIVRSFGHHHPKLRTALRPAWRRITQLLWALRNRLLGKRPIELAAGRHTVLMVAEGQIAEYVWRGGFESCERDFVVRKLRSGMHVLNIGANSGLYTIIASKIVGPTGTVHAFEPSSQNFVLLKKNVELNGCKNVVANNLALWNYCGQLSLNCDPLHPGLDGHFFVRPFSCEVESSVAPIETVPCVTLDDYWRQACGGHLRPVDFVIIDVEGTELSVFEGARQTLQASPGLAMLMECTDHVSQVDAFLHELGFSYYSWDAGSSRLLPTEIGRGNIIALRT